jgi:phospholipase/carboxylesterase
MLHSEFIPAVQKESRRLMVMLHGLGDSIEGYRWMPEALGLPWLNYLLVNAPDEYYGGYSWYDFLPDNPAPAAGVKRSREMLFKLLDAQVAAGFSAEQITLGGFSQGCLMSVDVALRYPHRFAGVVGISGYVSEPAKLLKELSPVALQQRLLITHGTDDPVIPLERIRPQFEMLKNAGVNLDFRVFRKVHTIAGEEELRVIRDFVRAGYSQT